MNKARHIDFDVTVVFGRAAIAAIRMSPAQSHGSAFADTFVAENKGAIQRAARARLNGRTECEVRAEFQGMRFIGQAGTTHE